MTGIVAGLVIVAALALFLGGVALGAWIQCDYAKRNPEPTP